MTWTSCVLQIMHTRGEQSNHAHHRESLIPTHVKVDTKYSTALLPGLFWFFDFLLLVFLFLLKEGNIQSSAAHIKHIVTVAYSY